jgi:hypothetical protein
MAKKKTAARLGTGTAAGMSKNKQDEITRIGLLAQALP